VDGEAEIGIHQISEILPVKGATLVGPLPEEIQNYTVYSAGISTNARDPGAAKGLIASFTTPKAVAMMKERGMAPANR
jgi:molybdate transport system substrate-binding protein